ncbi:unnamed protein product [Phaedon cochleariae]|uniref:EF-hand domain-containing protein n=1 Tax=Phaedon cochleariae TaxID=80249 RepID=A0A9N9SBE7_PHACE|nr:unnamed protein product [Phaedon cochleariae]
MDELPPEQLAVLRKAFEAFDNQKSGSIPCDMVADILRLMGQPFDKKILEELIEEVDADSNGYIPTSCLREILRELDDQLTDRELDMMIEEIDTDGSGTVDFDEFMEMMTGEV